jgi:hypothetical protein
MLLRKKYPAAKPPAMKTIDQNIWISLDGDEIVSLFHGCEKGEGTGPLNPVPSITVGSNHIPGVPGSGLETGLLSKAVTR